MQEKQIWLSISLFAEEGQWHHLLSKGVQQYLRLTQVKKNIDSFQISLNHDRGENIRLELLTKVELADVILEEADKHFKQHFSVTPYLGQNTPPPIPNSFFSSFPPNTIRYGLYGVPMTIKEQNRQHYKFAQRFSLLLLDVLDKPFNAEVLLTLVFQLHLGLLREMTSMSSVNADDLLNSSLILHPNRPILSSALNSSIDAAAAEAEYLDNKEMLLEVRDMVFDSPQSAPHWLRKWMKACDQEIERRAKQGNPPEQIHRQLANTMYGQLGSNEETRFLLSHFLRHVLQKPEATAFR